MKRVFQNMLDTDFNFLKTDYERAEYLQNILITHATGGTANDSEYIKLRKHFLDHPKVPNIVSLEKITARRKSK